MPRRKGVRLFKEKKSPNDSFEKVGVFIPKGTYEVLRTKAEELGIPLSRLMAIALDNELDASPPFNYPCKLPESEYRPYDYAAEAGRILEYLKKYPKGVNMLTLLLARRDMGIQSRAVFMLGLRDLLAQDVVEEFKNIGGRVSRYERDTVKIRIRHMDMVKMRKFKYKPIEVEK